MVSLCVAKRSANFTEAELEAWYAYLKCYKPETLNRAVIMLVGEQSRFPEISDMLKHCRRMERPERPYMPTGGAEDDRLTPLEVQRVARSLGLEV